MNHIFISIHIHSIPTYRKKSTCYCYEVEADFRFQADQCNKNGFCHLLPFMFKCSCWLYRCIANVISSASSYRMIITIFFLCFETTTTFNALKIDSSRLNGIVQSLILFFPSIIVVVFDQIFFLLFKCA